MSSNVFSGNNGLKNFLNPYNSITPLVEIPQELNPFFGYGVHIFLKLQYLLPLMNSKSITSYGLLEHTTGSGGEITNLVENSSGNTAFSLAVLGRSMGIENMTAYISDQVTEGKLKLLQLFGIDIVVNREPICPNPHDENSGIIKARKLGEKQGYFNPGQYDNLANPSIHYHLTAPQIYEQLEGDIDCFIAGLGTTGTFVGISKFLKEKNKDISCIGVVRAPNNPVPGPRTKKLLQQIDFDWEEYLDVLKSVGTKESYSTSLSFLRKGLLIGPSSGMVVSGLFDYLSDLRECGVLSDVITKKGYINIVAICPDSYTPYVNEYFKYTDHENFPSIKNAYLLNDKNIEIDKSSNEFSVGLSCQDAINLLYSSNKDSKSIVLNDDVVLFDLRSEKKYSHFHLYGSKWIDDSNIDLNFFLNFKKKSSLVFICEFGTKSEYFAQKCRALGLNAYSINGGTIEWSVLGYPRIKDKSCLI